MSEYVFLHIKTLDSIDIFIIDIDHLNMDLWISSSLHRQPEEGPQWVPGSCNILCFLFNKIDSWLDKSMKPRFGRIVAILLGIKNLTTCFLDLNPHWAWVPHQSFPAPRGSTKTMPIWYSWSHGELWKVMMKHKKSSVWLQGELKDALGYTSLRDCWDSGVPKSTKFNDTKYIMGHSDPLNIFLLEQTWVLIPHCATAHDSQRCSKRQTLGSTLNTPSGAKSVALKPESSTKQLQSHLREGR